MNDVALPVGQDQRGGDRAVRLLLGGDRGQADHLVRFEHDAPQQIGGRLAAGHEALEELARDQQHLVGRLAAAALAAHAVGQHRQQAACHAGVGEYLHLILLIKPVAAVDASRRCEPIARGVGSHAENYNRFSQFSLLMMHADGR